MTTPPQPPAGYEYGGPVHPPQPTQLPPAGPTRKPHWWRDLGAGGQAFIIIMAILVPLVAAVLVVGVVFGEKSASAGDLSVSPPSCQFKNTTLGAVATVSFTVTNKGDSPAENVRIGIEYRDSGGARLDTDTARISQIPAGDTVRVEESTNLDSSASGGTCELVGISAG